MSKENKNKTVNAHEDPDWDGVWATCPHCQHDNGVTWNGRKNCNQCSGEFEVAAGPLVRDPNDQHEISIFQGPGDLLFYNIGDDLSYP